MKNADLVKWETEAWAQATTEPLCMPLAVLLAEAMDLARFFGKHYDSAVDSRGVMRCPGLEQAAVGGRFRASLGQEILELCRATQAAHTAYLRTLAPFDSVGGRARVLLAEIVAALEFLAADGDPTLDLDRLRSLASIHELLSDPDALAEALIDYGSLALLHQAKLRLLGGFDTILVHNALSLARKLKQLPARRCPGTVGGDEQRALALRDRLVMLLRQRMSEVRVAARYVFRHQPSELRRAGVVSGWRTLTTSVSGIP